MYLKLILCYVEDKNKTEFQKRQAVWKEVESQDGLIFQIGGWDEVNPAIACKLALWESQELYQQFHQNVHDKIAEKANHKHLYYKIEIDFFHTMIPMPGKYSRLHDALQQVSYLRVANCHIIPDEKEAFISAQKNIWNPEMHASKGMLGGYFSQNKTNEDNFLVSTFWESKNDHDHYRQSKVKTLREKAKVDHTIKAMNSHFVSLVSEWSAIGKTSQSIFI